MAKKVIASIDINSKSADCKVGEVVEALMKIDQNMDIRLAVGTSSNERLGEVLFLRVVESYHGDQTLEIVGI